MPRRGHVVDLTGGPETLLKNLHPAMRRGIRKAEEKQIRVEFSGSPESVREYFTLHCKNRRRLGAPPQPARFFRNLAEQVLGGGHGFVAAARQGSRAVAAAATPRNATSFWPKSARPPRERNSPRR